MASPLQLLGHPQPESESVSPAATPSNEIPAVFIISLSSVTKYKMLLLFLRTLIFVLTQRSSLSGSFPLAPEEEVTFQTFR